MATIETQPTDLTVADLADRFGPIPLRRIISDPPPGTATEADVIEHLRHTGRACELIDGILPPGVFNIVTGNITEFPVGYHTPDQADRWRRTNKRPPLFFGEAGMPGMRMGFDLIPERGEGADHIYLETAAVVTTLILASGFFVLAQSAFLPNSNMAPAPYKSREEIADAKAEILEREGDARWIRELVGGGVP